MTLVRQSSDVGASARTSEHAAALVVQLADWAAATAGNVGGRPALQALSELPWAPGDEEDALIGWMVKQVGEMGVLGGW